MKLHDIHFCLGYVLGKRDEHFKDFIIKLKDRFIKDEYTRQELQKVLYQYYLDCDIAIKFMQWDKSREDSPKRRCFNFIKHTIRNHKNY